jgi:hypothetical protein
VQTLSVLLTPGWNSAMPLSTHRALWRVVSLEHPTEIKEGMAFAPET